VVFLNFLSVQPQVINCSKVKIKRGFFLFLIHFFICRPQIPLCRKMLGSNPGLFLEDQINIQGANLNKSIFFIWLFPQLGWNLVLHLFNFLNKQAGGGGGGGREMDHLSLRWFSGFLPQFAY
jgi:hypothetical protein